MDLAELKGLLVPFIVLFGLLIGSFLNVVIWRVPNKKSLLPGSACPNCGATITWWQNIPILSWLMLRGKCHNCKEPISLRYPLVEGATALFFGVVGFVFYPTTVAGIPFLIALLYFAAITVALALIDLDTKTLPNSITLPSFLVIGGLLTVSAILEGNPAHIVGALVGAFALSLVYFLLWRFWPGGGMGLGDVKLALSIGLITGWLGVGAVFLSWFFTFVIAAIFTVGLMALKKANRKTGIPFGPWLLLGAWLAIFFGIKLFTLYLETFAPSLLS